MSERPLIGVTGPVRGGRISWWMTRRALRRAGARCVRITSDKPRQAAALDGVVLGGGSDISPEYYGEELRELAAGDTRQRFREKLISLLLFLIRALFSVKLRQPPRDPARDELEKALCLYALERGLPLLGICRGAQLINVTAGGTLFQDTRDFYTETPHIQTIMPRKYINIDTDSRLHRVMEVDSATVNSLHNQAINELGEGIRVSARDLNGIIQAIEHCKHPFVIGVQWHPEYLPQLASQQRLFAALVARARGDGSLRAHPPRAGN